MTMSTLSDGLRRQLEKVVVAAREVGEAGATAAFDRLAVGRAQPFAEMTPGERELRVRLRARARQLGDQLKESGEQELVHLVSECAYEHWHRMLFARFLAENRLLIHPDLGVPVTLAECQELAAEAGEQDGWGLAGRFAARMLPQIFRPNDPVLGVRFAPEHQQALEKLLAELPAEVFTAADSLGWVYQFWQTKRKKEVNESGKKIGADELPAVTQLFTEPYMVQFLLHNTLGAWWAGKVLAARPELAMTATSEDDLRRACALPAYEWTYLRFVRPEEGGPWRPAAGAFEGWPERAGEIMVLDPCCGSGHFLAEAFRILVPMCMSEEGLSEREACEVVLQDNVFGLEIDERCTQIAAFNLALTAWTYPGVGQYRPLPDLNIACSGLAVGAKEEEWLKLAGKDARLREGMRRIYALFQDAPTLGSLIDPRREEAELFKAGFEELRPLLDKALAREDVRRDATATEAGIAAQGTAKAAALLSGLYTLVATNVPYLGRGAQADVLKDFASEHHLEAKADLATVFLSRIFGLLGSVGTAAVVTPQNWLFLASYRRFRRKLLLERSWELVARLGPGAFETIGGHVVNVTLGVIRAQPPDPFAKMSGIDVSGPKAPSEKANLLRGALPAEIAVVPQADQLKNPDWRILLVPLGNLPTLGEIAIVSEGLHTGDYPRFGRKHWEVVSGSQGWALQQGGPDDSAGAGGCEHVLFWEGGKGELMQFVKSRLNSEVVTMWIKGEEVWGKRGVAVGTMSELKHSLYHGVLFTHGIVGIVARDESHAPALLAYIETTEFRRNIRLLDQKLSVARATFENVPFDLDHWQKVAVGKYPNGLPEPESDDPTQWLFHGRPEASTAPLHVAVARLLGFVWPAELDETMRLGLRARELARRSGELSDIADNDGIVCVPPVRGEQPAADRLQKMLSTAYGAAWSPATMSALLDQVGFSGKTLENWLRDGFFEQQCQVFHQRPFIWHIWDGRRRDGFAALVNYHKLDRKLFERLTYSLLGDWIAGQRQGVKAGDRGAEDRLAAAEALQQKLALILEGEPPYDIFMRWKPLREQPIGWEPDLNDGVRMNIRPFVEAGVLRKNPKIKWTKDRGAEPQSLRPKDEFPWFWRGGQFTAERVNDVHLTNMEKRAARERARREGSPRR